MENKLTPTEALALAIRRAGDQRSLGNLLGVSQPTISVWLNRQGQVPAEYVLTIQHLLGISRYDLRPDLYQPYLDEAELQTARFAAVDSQAGRRFAA